MSVELSRRNFLKSAAAGSAPVLGTAAPGAPKPNVLFVFIDQLRADAVGYNGGDNVPTPNIDRLAKQGVVFTNAISSCPLCTPYRAMLQTGRWPTLSGGVMNFVNLPSTGQAIADVYGRAGYDTAFIGKWHLSAGGLSGTLVRGKRVAPVGSSEPEFVPPGPGRLGYQHWAAYNFHTNFASAVYYRDTPDRLTMPRYETDSETDMAIEFMRSRTAAKKPFFAMVAPHPPHPPWRANQVPAGCLDRVAPQLSWRPNVKARLDASNKDPRCYYAMIANVDDNIGRLMSFLDESGAAANTIVVLTSDHGEMLASHGRYNKMVPYAEAVNIPLIVRWPGRVRAGSNSDALFTPMDHFPTLGRLCGLEPPDIVDGMDLSPQVLGRRGPERDAALMMNFVSHWDYPETGSDWPEWRGLRTKQYTYARWLNGAEEFYDNAADRYQMRNLFDGRNAPVAMQHLRGRLRDLLRESHDEFPPGTAYAEWLTPQRNFVRNGLGPIRT